MKRNKPKASENKAKNVVAKPPKSYVLPEQLRQAVIQALQNSIPLRLSVGEVNQICATLGRLKETKMTGP